MDGYTRQRRIFPSSPHPSTWSGVKLTSRSPCDPVFECNSIFPIKSNMRRRSSSSTSYRDPVIDLCRRFRQEKRCRSASLLFAACYCFFFNLSLLSTGATQNALDQQQAGDGNSHASFLEHQQQLHQKSLVMPSHSAAPSSLQTSVAPSSAQRSQTTGGVAHQKEAHSRETELSDPNYSSAASLAGGTDLRRDPDTFQSRAVPKQAKLQQGSYGQTSPRQHQNGSQVQHGQHEEKEEQEQEEKQKEAADESGAFEDLWARWTRKIRHLELRKKVEEQLGRSSPQQDHAEKQEDSKTTEAHKPTFLQKAWSAFSGSLSFLDKLKFWKKGKQPKEGDEKVEEEQKSDASEQHTLAEKGELTGTAPHSAVKADSNAVPAAPVAAPAAGRTDPAAASALDAALDHSTSHHHSRKNFDPEVLARHSNKPPREEDASETDTLKRGSSDAGPRRLSSSALSPAATAGDSSSAVYYAAKYAASKSGIDAYAAAAAARSSTIAAASFSSFELIRRRGVTRRLADVLQPVKETALEAQVAGEQQTHSEYAGQGFASATQVSEKHDDMDLNSTYLTDEIPLRTVRRSRSRTRRRVGKGLPETASTGSLYITPPKVGAAKKDMPLSTLYTVYFPEKKSSAAQELLSSSAVRNQAPLSIRKGGGRGYFKADEYTDKSSLAVRSNSLAGSVAGGRDVSIGDIGGSIGSQFGMISSGGVSRQSKMATYSSEEEARGRDSEGRAGSASLDWEGNTASGNPRIGQVQHERRNLWTSLSSRNAGQHVLSGTALEEGWTGAAKTSSSPFNGTSVGSSHIDQQRMLNNLLLATTKASIGDERGSAEEQERLGFLPKYALVSPGSDSIPMGVSKETADAPVHQQTLAGEELRQYDFFPPGSVLQDLQSMQHGTAGEQAAVAVVEEDPVEQSVREVDRLIRQQYTAKPLRKSQRVILGLTVLLNLMSVVAAAMVTFRVMKGFIGFPGFPTALLTLFGVSYLGETFLSGIRRMMGAMQLLVQDVFLRRRRQEMLLVAEVLENRKRAEEGEESKGAEEKEDTTEAGGSPFHMAIPEGLLLEGKKENNDGFNGSKRESDSQWL